jgi:imidazolonepropionase-like amidohydrolase
MKSIIKFIAILLAGAIWSCAEKKEIIPADLAIRNITIIDAENEPRAGMTVLVKGERIVAIGPDLSVDEKVKVIDGTGKFLIPGLWDFHVHLTFDSLITPSMYDLFIANGITSIRDTGGLLEKMLPMKAQAESDPTRYPRLMMAGPLLDGKTVV